jgi:hypothetical protein
MIKKILTISILLFVTTISRAQLIEVSHFCKTVTELYEGNITKYKIGSGQVSGNYTTTGIAIPNTASNRKISMVLGENGMEQSVRYLISKDTTQFQNALNELRKIIGENNENYPNPDKYSKGLIFLIEPYNDFDLKTIDIVTYGIYPEGTFFLPFDSKAEQYSLSIVLKKQKINNNNYVFMEIVKKFEKPLHNVSHLLYKNSSSLMWEKGTNLDWEIIEQKTVEQNQKRDKVVFKNYSTRLGNAVSDEVKKQILFGEPKKENEKVNQSKPNKTENKPLPTLEPIVELHPYFTDKNRKAFETSLKSIIASVPNEFKTVRKARTYKSVDNEEWSSKIALILDKTNDAYPTINSRITYEKDFANKAYNRYAEKLNVDYTSVYAIIKNTNCTC